MKTKTILLLIFLILIAAFAIIALIPTDNSDVSTKYLKTSKTNDREKLKEIGVKELFDHYRTSDKNRTYYEVVSFPGNGASFILNYNKDDERLTVCLDLGSGWSYQFEEITERDLEEFVLKKFNVVDFHILNSLIEGNAVLVNDSTYSINGKILKSVIIYENWIFPKTNGSPAGF